MKIKLLFFFSFLFFAYRMSFAQISPGELSLPHQQLEGVDNCTSCHSVGKALSNENCLKCHTEIQTRIQQKKGLHSTYSEKVCSECHKEHHGKNFQIVRFEQKKFDHSITGFRLEGKHAPLDCKKCHQKQNIKTADIQKFADSRKEKTFLGLERSCISCHTDLHRGQFKADCASCHTFEQWKPAAKFSHDKSRYPLTGKHKNVECYSCHNKKMDDEKTVLFSSMEFSTCNTCHKDPHNGKFQQACASCHTTDDFHKVVKGKFDHADTKFPLKGLHSTLKCEQCHGKDAKSLNVAGEIGHTITKFQQCSFCHADAHGKQFQQRADRGECQSCHTENGFKQILFSIIDHNKTTFTLTGSHQAVQCSQCHTANAVNAKSTRKFKWTEKLQCVTCHNDIHKGQFNKKMTNVCETCHSTESWQTLKFSHDKTAFPLIGKHSILLCSQCHTRSKSDTTLVQYTGLKTECSSCHNDIHEKQFAKENKTNCERCHSPKSWKDVTFDHNKQARFSLTGKHEQVPCGKCHTTTLINQRSVVKYKPLGILCADCHTEQ